jgi:hypothetical protein
MTDTIVKTTITVTVLHRAADVLPSSLKDVLYEMDEGFAVGWQTGRVSETVPADQVETELIAVGNDGAFFDDVYGDDEEQS